MPQTTILASGTTAGTSTDIVIAAGSAVNVAIFSTDPGATLAGNGCDVQHVTPGALNWVGSLNQSTRSMLLQGPGTYRVARPVLPVAFGVCLDT
jgi:hypothetical protein